MSSPDSNNPFRSPEHQPKKYKATSNPSIDFEPHMRPAEETLEARDQDAVWHEPTLAGGGYRFGEKEPGAASGQMSALHYLLAGLIVVLGIVYLLWCLAPWFA